MPGVDSITAESSRAFAGTFLALSVAMKRASEQQVSDVAARITVVKGDHFTDYQQSTTFTIGDRADLMYGRKLYPEQVLEDVRKIRGIEAGLPAAKIYAHRNPISGLFSIRVTSSEHIRAVVDATRSAIGSDSATLTADATADDAVPEWEIVFPYTPAQEQAVHDKLDHLPPDFAFEIEVKDGSVSKIWVVTPDRASTETRLRAVIAAVQPTTAHPLALGWTDGAGGWVKPGGAVSSDFHGMVIVGGCYYKSVGEGGQTPTEEADALESKLRTELDTCPR